MQQVAITTPAANPADPNHEIMLAALIAGLAQATESLWIGLFDSHPDAQKAIDAGLQSAPVVIQVIKQATT